MRDGRRVLPVGEDDQQLVVLRKTAEGVARADLLPVRCGPMTGEALRGR